MMLDRLSMSFAVGFVNMSEEVLLQTCSGTARHPAVRE
jgi:hypothetical protein